MEVLEWLWIENLPFLDMVHRQENLTKHLMFCHTEMISNFTRNSCIPSSTALRNKDTIQMPVGVTLSPNQSLELFQLSVAA